MDPNSDFICARYLSAMAPGGTIFPLGVSDGNISIPYMPMIAQGLRIQGVLVAREHFVCAVINIGV